MALAYRFKKEKLENGMYVARPRILVTLNGKDSSIVVPALIDSGCDITVIPEGMARALGTDLNGKKEKLYAYREAHEVIASTIDITFLGKAERQNIKLNNIPVLVTLTASDKKEEEDITLGVSGIFDAFDITFKKAQNRILLKRTTSKKASTY